ncbi:aa3-type cytochrome c oxidase subunit IV [Mariluticola halotolerans]|uniref:aa3-type cytochrome c oxidase subunit IV n=1 Tax=Mariluticola halotolerans TaxID=2909283 RepID=UPI0026E2B860|nr:aa3-type cytochrome c oxidase subunit IV [Mariluticola halotolerans]UJQ95248.1 aa3-type cytochrome c oxidase subunit IV [Mariluticola halotolerans]
MDIGSNSGMSSAEYAAHERTYHGFVHVARWFCIHLTFVLVGLYFVVIQGAVTGGLFLILLGLIALVYGLVTTPGRPPESAYASATPLPVRAGGEDVIIPDPANPTEPAPPQNDPAQPNPLPQPTPQPEPPLVTPHQRAGWDRA